MKKIIKGISLVGVGYLAAQIVGNANRLKMIQDMAEFLTIEKMGEMDMKHLDLDSIAIDVDREVINEEVIQDKVNQMLADLDSMLGSQDDDSSEDKEK